MNYIFGKTRNVSNFPRIYFYQIAVLYAVISLSSSRDIELEFTVTVKPSYSECFFQDILAGETLDVEYQVIDGGQGNLDINFFLFNPEGIILIHDVQKSDGNHRTSLSDAGNYKICWENNFSKFSSKTVFFAVMIDGNKDDDDDGLWDNGFYAALKSEEQYDIKVEDIKTAMDKLRSDLNRARYLQDQIRAHEARDRNIAENNYSRVNLLSMINIIAMVGTGLLQVILLRSLFDEKSRFHKVWKKSS